ncbi:MAG TPA: S9 family peptidase [Pyrinomonadaceae bacterium]|jgi:dipeptidyl aminopeptidase/acylaminoacyl peptidase|nr:S9 family peptidase [Pyrinomonadaceae bacterium]
MRKLSLFFALIVFCAPAFAQNYTIQQYLNIKSATSPTLSPDGKKLAYLTNVSGTSQIWMVDLAENKPRQITSYDDNIGFVRWSPAGNGLVFGKARGGDENTQFFWMAGNGTEIRELTKDPAVRHNFGAWSEDGKKIYYASNKRNKNYFDIYSMDVAAASGGKEELLYQYDGNNDFAAVDGNETKIIVSRDGVELSLDNNLYLIDLKTRQELLLTPHEGSAGFGDVHFTADGIVYAQNDKREFYSLSNMRLKNAANKSDWSDANRTVKIIDETNWDIGSIEMQTYASHIAYTLNREGFSDLYLRKTETDGKPLITTIDAKAEKVQLPAQGIVGGLTFSQDESKLAFTFSSAKYNTDIWFYDLATKKLTQVTKSDRAGIDQASFVEPQLIKYKTFDGREIPAWYYRPEEHYKMSETVTLGARTVSNLPVIVSVHGGPEGQERPGFNGLYQYYLSRGYAILATNVRGSTGYGKTFTHLDDVKNREDSVKDLAYAVEWLKKDGGAAPKRIAVMGGSYGGYMTLAAITLYPDLWAAAVDTVGIANWESFLKNTSGYRRRQREVEYGRLDKDIDFLRAISPLAKVDKIKCPLFVIQGKNDPRVPYTEAEQIVKAVKDRGGIVQYKLYDDEGHGIAKLKNRLDLYPLVADFLDKYMK